MYIKVSPEFGRLVNLAAKNTGLTPGEVVEFWSLNVVEELAGGQIAEHIIDNIIYDRLKLALRIKKHIEEAEGVSCDLEPTVMDGGAPGWKIQRRVVPPRVGKTRAGNRLATAA
jgi:hypothetical protein